MSSLKAEASLNIASVLVTLLTSQSEMSALKADASLNIHSMLVTLLTSRSVMSAWKADAYVNIHTKEADRAAGLLRTHAVAPKGDGGAEGRGRDAFDLQSRPKDKKVDRRAVPAQFLTSQTEISAWKAEAYVNIVRMLVTLLPSKPEMSALKAEVSLNSTRW